MSLLHEQNLERALREIGQMIQNLPSGIDEEADPNETSPEDAAAHLGGLIFQKVQRALNAPPKRALKLLDKAKEDYEAKKAIEKTMPIMTRMIADDKKVGTND